MNRIIRLITLIATALVITPHVAPALDIATAHLLHGSFGAKGAWYQKGGDFHTALELHNPTLTIYPHTWSGTIFDEQMIEESRALALKIIDSADWSIPTIVIAHSNGGAVTAYASMLLAYAQDAATLAQLTPPRTLLKRSITNATDEPEHSMQDTTEACAAAPSQNRPAEQHSVHPDDETLLLAVTTAAHKAGESVKDAYQKKKRAQEPLLTRSVAGNNENVTWEQEPLIHAVYLLGTPIRSHLFEFDPSVVKKVYNCYSHGDVIQSVAGERTITESRCSVYNIALAFALDSGNESPLIFHPCHTKIHSALVGKYLLSFENIVTSDGTILLSETAAPHFTPA